MVLVVLPNPFNFGAAHDPHGALGLHADFPQGGGGHELQTGVFSQSVQPFFAQPQAMILCLKVQG